MQVAAVVAAAGLGTRLGMGSKALVALNGRTLLARAVGLFLSLEEVTRIVVVAPRDRLEAAEAAIGVASSPVRVEVCPGGASRQESVRAGLARLEGTDYVLVHDAARALASPELCRRVLAAAVSGGAAFPGVRPRDAVRRVELGLLQESLDRDRLVLAQTPQAFAYELLLEAHRRAWETGLAGDDDAALVAAAGNPVSLVPGDDDNLKLTTPADLALLELILRERETAAR